MQSDKRTGTVNYSLEHVIRLHLSRIIYISMFEQILDTKTDLLDGDRGFPRLFFVQDGETNCARRVDVGMEEWRIEFA